MGLDCVCLVGAEFRKAADEISSRGPEGLGRDDSIAISSEAEGEVEKSPLLFDTSDALAAHLAAHPITGCTVLVKGSRGTRMEKVLPAL